MTNQPKVSPESIHLTRNETEFSREKDVINDSLKTALRRDPPQYSRLLAGGLCTIVFSIITWASLSKVDEVAKAPAEIIPSSHVRPVKALAGGIFEEVVVEEGQRVKAGDPLVKLDPTLSEAEFQGLQQEESLTAENVARLEAERQGSTQANSPLQEELQNSRQQEYDAQEEMAIAEATRMLSGVKAADADLDRVESTLDVAEIKESSLRKLLARGAVARLDYLDAQNEVVSLQNQIRVQEQAVYQAQQAHKIAQAEVKRLSANRQTEILTQLEQERIKLESLKSKLAQAKEQRRRETITASVGGTVYNVKVSETGATLQPGEEILSILPEGVSLILEAKVHNQDIGFIEPGMSVKIKLETFPYQEFGLLKGTVKSISPNAVKDEEAGLVFPARIQIEQSFVTVQGQEVALTPGMAATAEIVIRQKTVLSFLLEPIIERWDGAFSIQ